MWILNWLVYLDFDLNYLGWVDARISLLLSKFNWQLYYLRSKSFSMLLCHAMKGNNLLTFHFVLLQLSMLCCFHEHWFWVRKPLFPFFPFYGMNSPSKASYRNGASSSLKVNVLWHQYVSNSPRNWMRIRQ